MGAIDDVGLNQGEATLCSDMKGGARCACVPPVRMQGCAR